MHHFKDIVKSYNAASVSTTALVEAIACLYPVMDKVEEQDTKTFWKAMRGFHEHIRGCHFDEMYARYQVSSMYHTKQNNVVCRGEIYTIEEAKRIYEKYVRGIDASNTYWDVYVAINAQFHDYAKLYTDWHSNISREELNDKIIASAINFWFKDEDAGKGKVWNYFKNIG